MNFTTLIILIFTAILAIGSVSKGLKLQHVNDYFECFKEDFKNVAFIGNNIKMRLKDCCVDASVPFDSLLDKFVDILTTFDKGLKNNLDAWLRIESTLAGK